MPGTDDWAVLPDGTTVPAASRAARQEELESYRQMVNRQHRDRLRLALALRLEAKGDAIHEADEHYLAKFAARWSAEEVTIVECWLLGRRAPTY